MLLACDVPREIHTQKPSLADPLTPQDHYHLSQQQTLPSLLPHATSASHPPYHILSAPSNYNLYSNPQQVPPEYQLPYKTQSPFSSKQSSPSSPTFPQPLPSILDHHQPISPLNKPLPRSPESMLGESKPLPPQHYYPNQHQQQFQQQQQQQYQDAPMDPIHSQNHMTYRDAPTEQLEHTQGFKRNQSQPLIGHQAGAMPMQNRALSFPGTTSYEDPQFLGGYAMPHQHQYNMMYASHPQQMRPQQQQQQQQVYTDHYGGAYMTAPGHHLSTMLPYPPVMGFPQSQLMPPQVTKPPLKSAKKHVCEVCGKRFTRPSSLQTHVYSHTGEKPFSCDFEGCGRHFSVVSNLRRHRKIHGL